jgi:hypothetical protein
MSSGKAIAALFLAIAGLRKMTNWLRKGSDTLERSDQFKERNLSFRCLGLASIVTSWEASEPAPKGSGVLRKA